MDHWIREMTSKKQMRLATGCARSMQQPQDAETRQYTHNKSDRGPTSNSKGTNRIRLDLINQLGGDIMFPRQWILLLLRHLGGKRQTAGGAAWKWESSSWSEQRFFLLPEGDFRLQEMQCPSNRRERYKQYTVRAHVFHMRTVSQCLLSR